MHGIDLSDAIRRRWGKSFKALRGAEIVLIDVKPKDGNEDSKRRGTCLETKEALDEQSEDGAWEGREQQCEEAELMGRSIRVVKKRQRRGPQRVQNRSRLSRLALRWKGVADAGLPAGESGGFAVKGRRWRQGLLRVRLVRIAYRAPSQCVVRSDARPSGDHSADWLELLESISANGFGLAPSLRTSHTRTARSVPADASKYGRAPHIERQFTLLACTATGASVSDGERVSLALNLPSLEPSHSVVVSDGAESVKAENSLCVRE
eukprot:4416416-Pleurochrysis_carterae.AAC.2